MSWDSSDRRSRLPADWEARRSQVLRRDDWCCQIQGPHCVGHATDVDHVRRGDDHSIDNLRAACSPCHLRKSSAEGNAQQQKMRSRRYRPRDRHPGAL
ncbi:HNH endonuclease [Rhodococcus hoagii]|nr:HNH endonuclease [Prescottella equi]MBM4592669.1 HNH endonuclease [Prescottella equi]